MPKLIKCLKLLESINNNSNDYSIGLAQDISDVEDEIITLTNLICNNIEWEMMTQKEDDLVNYLLDELDLI